MRFVASGGLVSLTLASLQAGGSFCWRQGTKMDSQGRKVVVCDNGTGVSLRTGNTLKLSPRLALGAPVAQFDRKVERTGNRK